FAVVLVADRAPPHAGLAEVLGDVGEGSGRAVERVLPFAGRAGEGVDDAEEEVARDVLEVAAVGEPLAGGRDVIRRALAAGLHQHWEVEVVMTVPRGERLEQLEPVGGRRDGDADLRPVRGRRLVAGLSGI